MSSTTLQQFHVITQDQQDARFTRKGMSITRLVHGFIREHGTHDPYGGYKVDIRDLDNTDKKLFLSHVLGPNDYADAIACPVKMEAEFWEESNYLEMLINENTWEVYQEDQEEMRSYK
jgi:hypothetical protein